jgi:acyl-CoA synthetase (NDP forming)
MTGQRALGEYDAKRLLADAGFPVVPTRLARNREEVAAAAAAVGFPVALKVASPDVLHKSDVGGVRLGLDDVAAVAEAYDGIVASVGVAVPAARLDGVTVQPMAPPGIELIVGVSRDPTFGPVVAVGLGGVLVEVLGDVALRVVPVEHRDATEMLRELAGYRLLAGFRGAPPVDLDVVVDVVVRISSYAQRHPELVELDLNPVLAYPSGLLIVDARATVEAADRSLTVPS